jgi:hypothetical protein
MSQTTRRGRFNLPRSHRCPAQLAVTACLTITLLVNAGLADAQVRIPGEHGAAVPASASVLGDAGAVSPRDQIAAPGREGQGRTKANEDDGGGVLQRALRREVARAVQNPATAPVTANDESWPVRHPVILGTLIGVPVGLVIQGKNCSDCWFLTGATAGAGAYGGLIASAIHKARRRQPISASTKAGLVAGTIASVLVASFIAGGSWSN